MPSSIITKNMARALLAMFFCFSLLFLGSRGAKAGSLTFSGTVVTPTGAVYSEGGGVNLNNTSGGGFGSGIDSEGKFAIYNLEPGTYWLDVGISSSSAYANPAQQQITLTESVTGFQIKVTNPTLKGVIATPDGTPTNGCVNVRTSTWTMNRGYCAQENGVWKLGDLAAGEYILELQVPDNSPYVGTETKVTVTNPSVVLDLGVMKFDNPFVVGKVALPDGTLVPWNDDYNQRLHLSVDMWNADWTVNKHSNYDQNSKFKFGRIAAGTYTLHVNIWDTETYTGSENINITVPETGLDMTSSPVRLTTPQLAGVVYRPDGSTPVQNANVNVRTEDGSINQGSSTDQYGKYRIGGLPAGAYKFEVNPPQDMTDVVRPDPVDINITSELQTKNVTLTTAQKFIIGSVKKKDGAPVFCARVNANKRGGNGWAEARTATDGSFKLTLASGSWNVRVEPDRSFECPEADWVFLEAEAVAEFANDTSSQTLTVNFTVEKATAIITGKVTKKNGTIITNGNLNANSQTRDGRNRWANAQIKADGTYKLSLIGGTYDVNVWTPDNTLYVKNQKITVSDNQTVIANFTMSEKLAHIKGKVTSKDGKALPNIQLNGNLDCGPEGCSAWSNTRTDSDGNYDMAVSQGKWNINFDSGQGVAYVYDGKQKDIFVETETSTVSDVNFELTYADVTIKGKVIDENDKPFSDFPGWAFVRPLSTTSENNYKEYGGPVNQGEFSIRVPSKLFSQVELGVHVPSNSQYSAMEGQIITLVADATIEKNIKVKQNDSYISGRIVDSSGIPLSNCNFKGEVFANNQAGQWYGTQIDKSCRYSINLLAGTYQIGYNFDQSAGFLNRPPKNEPITVKSGATEQFDIKVLAGDARVAVLILKPDGSPSPRTWAWADNHEEIDGQRQKSDKDNQNEDNYKGPGGSRSPEDTMKYCSDPKNKKECEDSKLPQGSEGPGGCKNAYACSQFCKKNKDQCKEFFSSKDKSEKKPEEKQKKEDQDFFDNMLNSGGETNDKGLIVLNLLSGHEYTIGAGLPPESEFMPPKFVKVNLKNSKQASATLQLRTADGKLSGFVTWNGVAVKNGWMDCWSDDGNANGSQIFNGAYNINYTFNSTYHCNANSQNGSLFLRSDENIISVGTQKTMKVNFTMGEANFKIPSPMSETFDSTQSHVMTLEDGTVINIPANALASSGNVTVNANPTINVQSQKTAQPLGYGYNLEAFDANNQNITKFNSEITACFKYSDEQLSDNGVDEGSLVPNYWDSASGTWKQPTNITQDTENNTVCVRSDHFTSYAVVSTSGKGRGQSLVNVTTKQSKGITKVTIGKGKAAKTITPFPKYKGEVLVGTLNVKSLGQIILAGQKNPSGEASTLKIYTVKGKLSQKIKPWGNGYREGINTLAIDDTTGDGYDDIILAPRSGDSVKVLNLTGKKTFTLKNGQSGSIIASAVDALKSGAKQVASFSNNQYKAWKFSSKKKGFVEFGIDKNRLQASGDSLEYMTLRPNISSVSPKTLKSSGTVKITIKGENFGTGSKVLINGMTPAIKVKAKGKTVLEATINGSALEKGKKNNLTVINPDGEQVTYSKLKAK